MNSGGNINENEVGGGLVGMWGICVVKMTSVCMYVSIKNKQLSRHPNIYMCAK